MSRRAHAPNTPDPATERALLALVALNHDGQKQIIDSLADLDSSTYLFRRGIVADAWDLHPLTLDRLVAGARDQRSGMTQRPLPLPKLPAAPDFPLDVFPDHLAAWIGDAAERARFRPDFGQWRVSWHWVA